MYFSNRRLFPVYWAGLSITVLFIDFITGPVIDFPITYILPVGLTAWYSRYGWGVLYGIILPLIRCYFVTIWAEPWTLTHITINAAIQIVVLAIFALLIAKISERKEALEQEVKILEGILPVCAFCKKIRDDDGWHSMESYITKHTEAMFSHGFCPECGEKHYGKFMIKNKKE